MSQFHRGSIIWITSVVVFIYKGTESVYVCGHAHACRYVCALTH